MDDRGGHVSPGLENCSSYSDVLIMNSGLEWIKIGRRTFKRFMAE